MHHILIAEPFPQINPSLLVFQDRPEYELHLYGSDIDPMLVQTLVIRSATRADESLLSQYQHLMTICRVGVGTENIDHTYCQSHQIRIINTPGANADAVADLVLRAMIALCRKTYLWHHDCNHRFDYLGDQLSSQTIGILGFGNIGKKIYQRLQGFGVSRYLIYDPYIDPSILLDYPGAQLAELDDLIASCDILTLHLPLTTQTYHMISTDQLSSTHDHLKIINTSRGSIIDEQALYIYLSTHPQASAMMDVWTEEPNHGPLITALLTLPNMILTPHIGALTIQANQAMHHFNR